jgi:hypothetical protein
MRILQIKFLIQHFMIKTKFGHAQQAKEIYRYEDKRIELNL